MNIAKQLVAAMFLFCCMNTQVFSQPGESRGELLYSMHCSACHTSEIHWREHKLATGWNSLKAQVRRWQASIGLGWSEEEITNVATYLNTTHYGFPVTDRQGLAHGNKLNQVLRRN